MIETQGPGGSPGARIRPRALAATTAGAAALSALVAAAALSSPAAAVSTRSFRLDDAAELSAGELAGASVTSDGAVVPGVRTARVALPDAALAYAVARGRGDVLYVGTGNEGHVLRVRGDAVETLAATGQLVVSALAAGPDGAVFAGTLPEGRVYALDGAAAAGAAPRELVRLEGAEHVWALVWDGRRRTLFAATGPEGKVFAVDPAGHASVWWDAEAAHVMSLALGEDGALYAGTDGEAIVARLDGPGRARVVWDFPGNEVTALAARGGVLAVAANAMPDPPAATPASPARVRPRRPGPGKGELWRVGADGRAERVFALDDGHFTDVEIAGDGAFYAAVGKDGRIHRVAPDRTHALWVDVDERQVLALDLPPSGEPEEAVFVTGDAGALYRVRAAAPAEARWTSKVLDAGFLARFGALRWRGDGALRFETRSGNRETPDETWSEWSAPLAQPGPVRSPAARFVQVRASLGADARLRAVELFYLPQNQRAVVAGVGLDAKALSKRRERRSADAPPEPSAAAPLAWKVQNPDGDALRYRVRFRGEGQRAWRDILPETEVLTKDEYVWDTSGVPDGWYVVQVEVSDEPANPDAYVLRDAAESEPFLVDNHPPRIEDLRAEGATVRGTAADSLGPIAQLEVAVDGGAWRPFFPEDDLLDEAEERFALDVAPLLEAAAAGDAAVIVAVRATDAGGNAVTAETEIRRPRRAR